MVKQKSTNEIFKNIEYFENTKSGKYPMPFGDKVIVKPGFNTKQLEDSRLEFVENMPYDLTDLFNKFISDYNKHLFEIKDKEKQETFFKGLKMGIEFQKFIYNEKSEQ